jgi:hypothetical protein
MSQKILGDMKGIYAQMHEDAAFEAAVEDIVISVTYNMLSEGKTVDEIVEVLSGEDEQVILEHYAASQHSTTLTEDLDYDYYTEDFELVCERLGLIKGLFGLAKGGGKLLMKGGKALVKGAPPVAKKVAAGVGRGARVVKAKIGRAIGPKGRQALGKVSNVVKNVGVPVAAGAAGYMLGKGSSEAEAEAPQPSGPKKDEKPAYPGGQSKKEGEEVNKKYQELRTKAVDAKGKIKDQEAVKKAEDYGKAQWAKLYPNLAAKVKPDGTQKGTGQSQMEKDAEELRAMQKASQERQEADKKKVKKEAYEVVLDYLLSEGHADTVEEAHYVMMQMDAENIQSIVAESGYFPDKKSQKEDKEKHNLSTGELPGRHKPVKRNPDGSLKIEQMMPPINPEEHRKQQRIEKATQLKKGTSGAESQAAGAAVKRLGGSGVSLPPV